MSPRYPAPPSAPTRLALIDALRGFAVAQMIVYHFIWDLGHFGWLTVAMNNDLQWIAWRSAIVTQFLLLAGVSLALRAAWKPSLRDFAWRWLQIAAAAALVSIGSWSVVGPRFIYFGILHFVAAALLIVRPAVRFGIWNLLLAAIVVATWLLWRDPWFDSPPQVIAGLITNKPQTDDYVPLLPWLAPVFAGAALGALWRARNFALTARWRRVNERAPRVLVALGAWPLSIYLLHQPVLLGLLWLLKTITSSAPFVLHLFVQ